MGLYFRFWWHILLEMDPFWVWKILPGEVVGLTVLRGLTNYLAAAELWHHLKSPEKKSTAHPGQTPTPV